MTKLNHKHFSLYEIYIKEFRLGGIKEFKKSFCLIGISKICTIYTNITKKGIEMKLRQLFFALLMSLHEYVKFDWCEAMIGFSDKINFNSYHTYLKKKISCCVK